MFPYFSNFVVLDSKIVAVIKCLKYNFLSSFARDGDDMLFYMHRRNRGLYSSGLHRDQRPTGVFGPITKFPEQVADSRGQQVK